MKEGKREPYEILKPRLSRRQIVSDLEKMYQQELQWSKSHPIRQELIELACILLDEAPEPEAWLEKVEDGYIVHYQGTIRFTKDRDLAMNLLDGVMPL